MFWQGSDGRIGSQRRNHCGGLQSVLSRGTQPELTLAPILAGSLYPDSDCPVRTVLLQVTSSAYTRSRRLRGAFGFWCLQGLNQHHFWKLGASRLLHLRTCAISPCRLCVGLVHGDRALPFVQRFCVPLKAFETFSLAFSTPRMLVRTRQPQLDRNIPECCGIAVVTIPYLPCTVQVSSARHGVDFSRRVPTQNYCSHRVYQAGHAILAISPN